MARKSPSLNFSVQREDAGNTLLVFLQQRCLVSSRKLKKALDLGACSLNGFVERFGSIRLKTGDRIRLIRRKLDEVETTSSNPPLSILFEDPHLLVLCKPSALVVDREKWVNMLSFPIFLVHRLDRFTSGVMIAAKTKQMQEWLMRAFRKREVDKCYLAVVHGHLLPSDGMIANYLTKKGKYDGQTIWGIGKKGLYAKTYWRKISQTSSTTLLECIPKTGRMHQLRVHLSAMGCPILGDFQYGRFCPSIASVDRMLLHSHKIAFYHPMKRKKVSFTAPLPSAFAPYL